MPAISTIGVKVSYAIETTPYTRPTDGYKRFPFFKTTPETNSQPETADATSFENERFTSSVRLLQTLDGALTFVANYTPELVKFYNDPENGVLKLYEDGIKGNKHMWICIDVPTIEQSVYIEVEPVPLGLPSLDRNSLAETNVYFIQNGEPIEAEDPTYYSTSYQEWYSKVTAE